MNLDRPFVDPSAIGEFISLNGCPRYHKFHFTDYESERRNERDWKEAFEPLSLLFARDGGAFETAVGDELSQFAHSESNFEEINDWNDSQSRLRNVFATVADRPPSDQPTLLLQSRLGLRIEAWPVAGDADIIAVWPTADGIRIRVLDIKASHEEKTYQQIQVAVYTTLLRQFLDQLSPAYSWTLEGGIITRETDLTSGAPEDLPAFDVTPRELDVRNLLQADGRFDELHRQEPETVRYQLGSKCGSCVYKEACYTDAVEELSTAALGMSIGEQNRLAEYDLETIHDLAELAYPEDDPRPYDYDTELMARNEIYNELRNDPELGPVIHQYVQRAHAMLGEIHDHGTNTSSGNGAPPYLLGSGDGSLPADDPPYQPDELPVARGELIRIYLNVQHDNRRDRVVMCAAYVTATNSDEARHVSEIAPDLSMETDASHIEERAVLDGFWEQLTATIHDIADSLGRMERVPIHFYIYTSHERTALMEAATRHDTTAGTALQDLLSLRDATGDTHPDQAMVSIVQDEIRSRFAMPIPNLGLLPVKQLFSPPADRVPNYEWEFTRSDGTHIENLRDAFRFKLFDYTVRYRTGESGLHLHTDEAADGWYPSRLRGGAQIPLEYIWAALGQLTENWVKDLIADYDVYQSLDPFLWVDRDQQTTRIVPEDITALGEYLAQCVAHIERGIRYRNDSLTKRPLRRETLETFTVGESDLAGALTDVLHLEHYTARNETVDHLSQPIRQRIQSGDAIPLVIRAAEQQDDGSLRVEGRLLYDQLFPDDHERIANACRKKAAEGSTGGSWMVVNELTRSGEPARSAHPNHLERGPGVTIDVLDVDSNYIELSAVPSFTQEHEFTRYHRSWAVDDTDGDNNTLVFDQQTILILDPQTDDLLSQRAFNVLETAGDQHPLLGRLEALATGQITDSISNTDFRAEVEAFTAWCKTNLGPKTLPSPRQRAFIHETRAQFSLLQGPPGTGKTGGSLALAVVARLYAWAQRDHPLVGAISGESNKAVDEVLADVADTVQAFVEHPDTDTTPYENVELVRLTNEPPEDPHPYITYLNYHEKSDAREMVVQRLRRYAEPVKQTRVSETPQPQPHTLVFATPARLYKLIDMLADASSAEERVAQGETYFDLLAIDEASMMRLPSFALCSAWLHESSQVLIAGDHRQMAPVRQHEWDHEDRRPIQEYAPHLSTLDWFRALRGDDVAELDETYGTELTGTATIPLTQLAETHRCHEAVTAFLANNVYAKDGIPYTSNQTKTLGTPNPVTEGLAAMLQPDAPFVLVVHNDDTSRQSNPVEAAIAAAVSQHVGDGDATGIVTPHNAQRGLIQARLDGGFDVDTVERYQGGQRECILVSATASEPGFLQTEDEFILNPNRLTVAMSRMQHKLIVVASEEVFRLIPQEADVYDQADLWKRLFTHMDALTTVPAWEGTVTELVPTDLDIGFAFDDASLQVYHPE
ncbi:bifunctional RecB family nuclease/DEAD/DEAH box helicase [Halocatena pleomorpha]|uniref:DNA2/NAM7 helicase-like C-terminal domain-containing protein n=1 Tax=Halocatena pleomorpha TaxID=1785090 RepID=A0A3P3RAG7_9EURY|nr:AAA domain-containing protein [Halocatena pleomorpha]RRJ29423.1 hypothetical protein EIK79_12325 [Halocatena pleomorpha]